MWHSLLRTPIVGMLNNYGCFFFGPFFLGLKFEPMLSGYRKGN
jgi:hypothetical protein